MLDARKELLKLVQPQLNIGHSGRPRKKPLAEESARAKNFLEMIQAEGAMIAALLATTAGHQPPHPPPQPPPPHPFQ